MLLKAESQAAFAEHTSCTHVSACVRMHVAKVPRREPEKRKASPTAACLHIAPHLRSTPKPKVSGRFSLAW